MKKLIVLSAIATSSLLYADKATAQVSIHFGINIPVHHVYVPAPRPVVVEQTPVYDDDDENIPASYNDDDYYYLPEVEAYYCVPRHCYYYNNGSNWVTAAYLPGAYRDYNWRTAVRYEVRSSRPYLRHDFYRARWGGYAGDRGNWGHRFDRRFNGGGYAYSNRGWNRGDYNRGNWNRGNWGGRSNQNYGDNRGNWNRGNWGGRSNQNDNNNRGNWNRGNDNNRGNWGGRRSNDNQSRGNNNGERFAQNRSFGSHFTRN